MSTTTKQKVVTNLWFEANAEEAVNFYVEVFGGRVLFVSRYGEAGPGPAGTPMTIEFELFGQRFTAINGHASFPFSPAVSLLVECDSQQEVDRYWDALLREGKAQQCGWLSDKYGLCWQIVPRGFEQMMTSTDEAAKARAMKAMLKMVKLDLPALERAFRGESA